MFLLDTNVISELRKTQRADRNVRNWADQVEPAEQFLSVITLHELEYGILLKARRSELEAAKLSEWMRGSLVPFFTGRILAVEQRVALDAAALHVPRRMPDRDAWIAATARVHGLTMVTRNVRDFVDTGVKIVNPWEA